MVHDFVMTQENVQTELSKPDAVGMGSYNSDSHNVERFVNADGNAENDTRQLTERLVQQGAVMEDRPPVLGPGFFRSLWMKYQSAAAAHAQLP